MQKARENPRLLCFGLNRGSFKAFDRLAIEPPRVDGLVPYGFAQPV